MGVISYEDYKKKKKKQLDEEHEIWRLQQKNQKIKEENESQTKLLDKGQGSFGNKAAFTISDFILNATKGGIGAAEGVTDFVRRRTADVADFVGWDSKAKQLRKTANQNTTEGIASDLEHILYGDLSGSLSEDEVDSYDTLHKNSVLTDRSRGIAQSVGYSVTNAAMSTAMGGGNVGSLILTGVSAGGSAESRAIEQGMDADDAFIYGILSGSGEAVSEAFFGGVGNLTKALGYGKGALDDVLIESVTKRIGSNVLRSLTSFGLRAGGEGFEEILSAVFDTAAQKISGMDERSLAEIWQDQNVGQAFVDGVISSMFSSSPRLVSSIATGTNYDNGTTRNEQKVIEDIIDQRTQGQKLSNKERGDLRQQITKDLIEGRIAGSEIDKALQNTETTWNQNKDRYITRTIINENTKFATTDDDLKIDKKQLNKNANLEDVQNKIKVLEQDFLNANNDIRNTTSSHELFDEMKRMIVATGEQQRLTSNKQMAEDGALKLLTNKKGEPIRNGRGELQYVKADTGQLVTINGYHTKDGMVLNADTHQAFESTMGHELGESLKANTPEIYKQLRDLAVEVGRADGTLTKETFDAIKSTYGELGTNTDNYLDEYVNDKIGEMFKSDSSMFQEIGKKPNIARRLLNEIKYLIQKFTAGSPEQKRLLEAQHNLKKALHESVRNLNINQEQKTENIQQQTTEDIAPIKEQVKEKPKEFTEVTDEDLFNINMEEVENQFDKQEYKLNEDADDETSFGNYWDLDDYNFKLKDGNTLWIETPREYGKYKNGKTNYQQEIYNKIDFMIEDSNGEIIDEYSIENEKGEFTREDILNAIKHMTYDDSNKVADGQLDIFDNVHRNNGVKYSLSDYQQMQENTQRQIDQAYQIGEDFGRELERQYNEYREKNPLQYEIYEKTDSKQTENVNDQFFKEHESDYDGKSGTNTPDGKVTSIKLQKGDNLAKLSYTENEDKIWIDELYVKNQKQGYGSEIVNAIKDYADRNGKYVEAFKELQSAKGFWDKTLRKSDTRYSLGKHYGDLGKGNDTYYFQMANSRRSTGHFGTGTYFVNENYQPGESSSYANRPSQTVEFDNYNLFRPSSESDGFDLHDALKQVNYNNTPISQELYDKLLPYYEGSFDTYNELLYADEENDFKNVRELLEQAGVETEDPKSYYDSGKGMFGNSYERYLDREITDVLNDYDYYNKAKRDLQRILGIDDTQFENAIEKVRETEKAYENMSDEDQLKADSLSTVFMKELGYNGIDVRGYNRLDNTEYGSVIYDLDNKINQTNLNDIKSKEEMDNVLSDFRNRIDNIKTGEDLKNTFRDVFNFYQQWDNNNYTYEVVEKDGLYGTKFESDDYKPDIKYRPLNEEIEIQKDNMNSWLNHLADNTDEIVYYNQDKVTPTIGKEINSLEEVTPITTREFQNELKDYISNETKDIKGKFESKDGHLYRGGNEVQFVYRAVDQAEMDSIIKNGYIKSNQSKNIGYEIEQGLTDFKDDYPGFYLPRNADGYILKVEVRPENGFFYDSDEYAKTPNSIPASQIVEINGEKINNIAPSPQNKTLNDILLRNKNLNQDSRIDIVQSGEMVDTTDGNIQRLQSMFKQNIQNGEYKNKATDYVANINSETKSKILFPAQAFKKNSDRYVLKLIAANNLPTLFENAVYIDTLPAMKGKETNANEIGYHHFVAPIEIDGTMYRALISGKEKQNSKKLYGLDVEIIPQKNGNTPRVNQHSFMGVSPTDISISDLVDNVKIYNYDTQQFQVYNDKNIKFSLSPSGEMQDSNGNKVTLETSDTGTTGTLMALHNLGEEKFNGILDLDGIPVPSIAITNPEIVNHSSFGDGTLIFDKETINPANRDNEVYDRDVWTPTMGDNAQIDYNIEPEKLWALEKNMYRNYDEISSPILNEYFDSDNLKAKVDNYGIEGTIDQAKNSKELKYIYYKTKNPEFEIMKKTESDDLSTRYSNEMLQDFAKKYNKEIPNWTKISDNQRKEIVNEFENYWKPILEERRDEIIKEENSKPEPKKFVIGMAEASVENNLEWLHSLGGQDKLIEHLHTIQENGGTRDVNDVNGTLDFVENNVNQEDFNNWIDNTLGNVLRNAEKGIYNGKEIITESGRRTFKQTHYPYNLKNLVKVLTQGDTKGTQNSMNGFGKIQAKMGNQFSSIDEIRQSQNQLTTPDIANEYIQDIENAIKEDVSDLSDRLDGDFFNWDNANILMQDFASQPNRNEESFRRLLKDYANKGVSSELIERIANDLEKLKTIPTDYFEAKPQRAVGLDEIQMAVIPNNWSEQTKQRLQDKGIKYTEYDPNVEGDRQRVINQFDELKFSLSNPDDIAPFGEGIKSEQIKPRDIQQVIAPLQDSINQLTQKVDNLTGENRTYPDDLSDLTVDISPFQDMIDRSLAMENGIETITQNFDTIKNDLIQRGMSEDAATNFLQNAVNKYDQEFNRRKVQMSESKRNKLQKMILDAQEKFTNRNAYVDRLAKDSGNQMIKYKGDIANNSFGEAQYNVQTAQTDLQGNEIGKSVNKIFEQAKKQKLDAAFEDYLFNQSNIERHAVGKGSQVPANVSEQLVRDYESQFPQFKAWAKDIETYYDNLLTQEVNSGLIDQDTFNLLRGEQGIYRSYVPFFPSESEQRYFDDAGNLRPIKPLKRAQGGAKKIMGIQDAMNKQTMAVWNSMRTNQLYQEILNTVGSEEGLGFIVRNDPSNLSHSLYTDQDGNKFLTAYVNGEERSTKISDDLYNELSRKSENAIKDLEDKYSLLTKPVQGLSKLRRNILTSYNPIFALYKNPVKDIQDAVLYSKHTAQMLKELPSSYGQLLTNKTKEAKQFRALYGSGEYTGFGKGYAAISEMIELAPRFAEFKASLKAGESVEQAIYNARDITTNFGRGGYVTKAMNRNGFTFLNASVQGFSKFYRNFAEQPNAGQFAMAVGKAALLGIVPAVFNELAFGGGDDKDEEYEAQPDYIKDNYYLFKKGDGEFIRIPKGRALSVIGSAARRTLERIEGEEDAFDGYLKNAWSQIGPVEIAANPLDNTIVAPIAQVLGGEKGTGGNTAGRAWYGGDIVPYRLQGERPEDQSDASVDKMSIWLGEKLGISPYKINYVIDQYSGGLGDVILPMMTEETNSGAETPLEYAIAPIKDQIVVNSIDDNKYASEFYSTKEKLYTGSKATDKELLKAQYMNDVSYDLSALYKEKRAIQSDSSLGKKEKYEKVQQVQKQINDIAKAGLELSDKITVQGNYADVGEDRGYYKNTKGKWTAISQDDMVTIESLGLTDSEKSAYFDVKNQIYNLDNDYRTKKEGKSEAESLQIGIQQKKDRIETIKSSTLPDSAKYAMFDTKYDDKLLPYYEDLGFNANDILDYKQQVFTADKDKNGKTITNSKKKKVIDYINNSNMPYEQKLILYKKEYKSDKSYDSTIFNYINNSNLDYTSKTKILDELGIKYR